MSKILMLLAIVAAAHHYGFLDKYTQDLPEVKLDDVATALALPRPATSEKRATEMDKSQARAAAK